MDPYLVNKQMNNQTKYIKFLLQDKCLHWEELKSETEFSSCLWFTLQG